MADRNQYSFNDEGEDLSIPPYQQSSRAPQSQNPNYYDPRTGQPRKSILPTVPNLSGYQGGQAAPKIREQAYEPYRHAPVTSRSSPNHHRQAPLPPQHRNLYGGSQQQNQYAQQYRDQRQQHYNRHAIAAGFGTGAAAGNQHNAHQGQRTQRQGTIDSMASNVTTGADNWGEGASGGLEGLARNVAGNRPRESGVEAMRGVPAGALPGDVGGYDAPPPPPTHAASQPTVSTLTEEPVEMTERGRGLYPQQPEQAYHGYDSTGNPFEPGDEYSSGARTPIGRDRSPYEGDRFLPYDNQTPGTHNPRNNPQILLGGAPMMSGANRSQAGSLPSTAGGYSNGSSGYAGSQGGYYDPHEAVHNRYSQRIDPAWQLSNPDAILDDDDDGLEYKGPKDNRGSMLSRGGRSHGSGGRNPDRNSMGVGAAVAGGVAAGAAGGILGGMLGRGAGTGGNSPVIAGLGSGHEGMYGRGDSAGPSALSMALGSARGGPNREAALFAAHEREKASLAADAEATTGKKRRLMWIIIILVALAICGGIAGGVAGALVNKGDNSNSVDGGPGSEKGSGGGKSKIDPDIPASAGKDGSAAEDTKDNGDLGKDSKEIKALLGNKDLKRVFPGMDYTPMYTQYPDCLHYPPSQNNITRDIAVISQLTNVVRLYGTDCNQTEMVIHAIERLDLKSEMKIWLGVWQDGNATTNARQIEQMYTVLDTYGDSWFSGAIIANEVLFREEMTESELIGVIKDVKSNFTDLGYKIPIATSDLGDSWTQKLADSVDYLMSNVHPFFTGKPVADAAEFTWQFWQWQNYLLKPDLSKNYIAETGWPTKGGTNCGYESTSTTCDNGSDAGVNELNQFMEDWVCQALSNGTNYFWFEAFDEPWKIRFNEKGKAWEDQWGLLDVNRNIKDGVNIPDCDGKRVGKRATGTDYNVFEKDGSVIKTRKAINGTTYELSL